MRRVVFLVLFGLLLGALLTGIAGALPGSQDLNALTWLATVATVAALVVAVGIYQVQQSQSDLAHQELLDALKAQDEILQDLADATTAEETEEPAEPAESGEPGEPAEPAAEPELVPRPEPQEQPRPVARPTPEERAEGARRRRRLGRFERLEPGELDELLSAAQRDAVEQQYGEGAIEAALRFGDERGNRPRLVRLNDGTVVSVTNPDRNGRIQVHELGARHAVRGDRVRERRARPKAP